METDFLGSEFKYGGKTYSFQCALQYTTKDGEKSIGFDAREVQLFTYETKLNSLCIHGRIVYTDAYGMVDRVLDEEAPTLMVYFVRDVPISDKDITVRKHSDTEVFSHAFLVDNVKIINRLGDRITYELSLVSLNWFDCMKNVTYTNYDKEPESVFDIMKACLVTNGLGVHTDSFDAVKTDVKIDYITTVNDNVFTVQKYLFHKLYYNGKFDDSLKYLIYDHRLDQYRLFDIDKPATRTGDSNIQLSMMKSSVESLSEQDANNFGMVAQVPRRHTFQNFITHEFYDYDYASNTFVDQTISAETLVNLYNTYIPKCHLEDGLPKVNNDVLSRYKYVCAESHWNSYQNIYDNMTESLNKDNSLIVNTTGHLQRQPGYYVYIAIDRHADLTLDSSHTLVKKELERYMSYDGLWIASKVENIVEPAKGKYRQNLCLMRNYMLDKEAIQKKASLS